MPFACGGVCAGVVLGVGVDVNGGSVDEGAKDVDEAGCGRRWPAATEEVNWTRRWAGSWDGGGGGGMDTMLMLAGGGDVDVGLRWTQPFACACGGACG